MALVDLMQNPQVSAFLLDPGVYDVIDGIAQAHGLPVERSEEFLDLTEAVLDGTLELVHMPVLLAEAFGLDEAKAQAVAADIAGQRLLPFLAFIPGIDVQITAWGGDLQKYPNLRIQPTRSNLRSELIDIAKRSGIEFSDNLAKRLLFLLEQFARGEKTEESLKTFFTRSSNIGGLGLSAEQAQALLLATLPRASSLLEVSDDVSVKTVSPESDHAAAASPVAVQTEPVTQELEISPSHEMANQVPVPIVPTPVTTKVAPLMAKKAVPSTEVDIDPTDLKVPAKKAAAAKKVTTTAQDALGSAVALATAEAAAVMKKTKISEKVFADVASKAIRGLRDVYQTRDLIERDWEVKGQDLASFMQAITAGIAQYEASGATPLVTEKPAANAATSQGDAGMDARFDRLTSPGSGAVKPVHAELTVGSSTLKTADGQRKMVDVVSSARLMGPVEQLGKMTTTEFRRLSSSASEAAQKIEDLLSALETTAYEERVKGVLAWRESPMNQLYLQITQEALSQGLALPEVSSRRRAAGKESLSPGEMKALALLNSKIRF